MGAGCRPRDVNREVADVKEAERAFEKAAVTLGKYLKNKAFVPPEELASKYGKSFGELRRQLKEDLEAYLKACILEGVEIYGDAGGKKAVEAINALHKAEGLGERVGRIAFGGCPPYRPGADRDAAMGEVAHSARKRMGEIREAAEMQRKRVWEEVYMPYLECRKQHSPGSREASEKVGRHGQAGGHKGI